MNNQLKKAYEILGVVNYSSAVKKAREIEGDIYLFGHSTQYTDIDLRVANYILNFKTVHDTIETQLELFYS